MKINCILIFFAFSCIIFPIQVYAINDVEFQCPKEAMIGNKITCQIKLSSIEGAIKGVQANYQFRDSFSYVKTEIGNDWSLASSHNEGFMVVNISGVNKEVLIATVTFLVSNKAEVGKEYVIDLTNIKLSDGEKDISIANKNVSIKILSISDVIQSLLVNQKELEIKDGVTNYIYNINNKITSAHISAILMDGYQFLEGDYPKTVANLDVGENIEEIKIGTSKLELVTLRINLNRLPQDNNILEETMDNPKTGEPYIKILLLILLASVGGILLREKRKKVQE